MSTEISQSLINLSKAFSETRESIALMEDDAASSKRKKKYSWGDLAYTLLVQANAAYSLYKLKESATHLVEDISARYQPPVQPAMPERKPDIQMIAEKIAEAIRNASNNKMLATKNN